MTVCLAASGEAGVGRNGEELEEPAEEGQGADGAGDGEDEADSRERHRCGGGGAGGSIDVLAEFGDRERRF